MSRRITPPWEADRLRDGCLATLRALGKTVNAQVNSKDDTWMLQLRLGTNAQWLRFEVGTTRSHFSYPLAAGFTEQARRAETSWLLFAIYVPGTIGRHLASQRVSYVDTVGNCHIEVGERLIAHVEGKKAVREAGLRIRGITSYQLLFALLAQPDLVEAPVRTVALAAGIGKSAVLEQLGRLNMQELLDYHSSTGLLRERELLDRWLHAYAVEVRPSWLIARCRPQVTDPQALEAVIERACSNREWAFGGAAAAHRMLAFDCGPETVLHLAKVPVDLLDKLQAARAADGPLTILHTPGALAYQGAQPHLAHPLLIYTELLSANEPRAAGAAEAVREQFLARVTYNPHTRPTVPRRAVARQ